MEANTTRAEYSLAIDRSWRFRVGEVRITMLEAVVWLSAWFYLPDGVSWLAKVFGWGFIYAGQDPLDNSIYTDWWHDYGRLGLMVLFTGVMVAYVLKFRKHRPNYLGLSVPLWKTDGIFTGIVALIAGGVFGAFILIMMGVHASKPEVFNSNAGEPALRALMRAFGPRSLDTTTVISMVIVYPVIEELWFRGWLYPVLRSYFKAWPAILLCALIFGFAHARPGYWIPASQLIGGVVFSLSYERRPNLYVPIVLHMLGNGTLILLTWIVLG